jgi:hypothetical protein
LKDHIVRVSQCLRGSRVGRRWATTTGDEKACQSQANYSCRRNPGGRCLPSLCTHNCTKERAFPGATSSFSRKTALPPQELSLDTGRMCYADAVAAGFKP